MTFNQVDQKMKTSRSKPTPRRQRWLLSGKAYPNRAAYLEALKARVEAAALLEG